MSLRCFLVACDACHAVAWAFLGKSIKTGFKRFFAVMAVMVFPATLNPAAGVSGAF